MTLIADELDDAALLRSEDESIRESSRVAAAVQPFLRGAELAALIERLTDNAILQEPVYPTD